MEMESNLQTFLQPQDQIINLQRHDLFLFFLIWLLKKPNKSFILTTVMFNVPLLLLLFGTGGFLNVTPSSISSLSSTSVSSLPPPLLTKIKVIMRLLCT